ncbi:putative multi-domain containing protein [Aduncisulcus paluster]|uniref:Multi-domain containing protein n=2 Tax=Aduncisulcus paluster TaxID=2918883 RepID=A0ABQ5KG55_9EUKA|nr:putative multi-domain containing protein [Aduncisulcus paluster]
MEKGGSGGFTLGDKGTDRVVDVELRYQIMQQLPFRFVITTESCSVNHEVLSHCICVHLSPPPGVQHAISRSLSVIDSTISEVWTSNMDEELSNPNALSATILPQICSLICVLFSVVMERTRFLPLGWRKNYDYGNVDLISACKLSLLYFNEIEKEGKGEIRLKNLRQYLLHTIFGSKLDDRNDMLVLKYLISVVLRDSSISDAVSSVIGSKASDSSPYALTFLSKPPPSTTLSKYGYDGSQRYYSSITHRYNPIHVLSLPPHTERGMKGNVAERAVKYVGGGGFGSAMKGTGEGIRKCRAVVARLASVHSLLSKVKVDSILMRLCQKENIVDPLMSFAHSELTYLYGIYSQIFKDVKVIMNVYAIKNDILSSVSSSEASSLASSSPGASGSSQGSDNEEQQEGRAHIVFTCLSEGSVPKEWVKLWPQPPVVEQGDTSVPLHVPVLSPASFIHTLGKCILNICNIARDKNPSSFCLASLPHPRGFIDAMVQRAARLMHEPLDNVQACLFHPLLEKEAEKIQERYSSLAPILSLVNSFILIGCKSEGGSIVLGEGGDLMKDVKLFFMRKDTKAKISGYPLPVYISRAREITVGEIFIPVRPMGKEEVCEDLDVSDSSHVVWKMSGSFASLQ